MRSAVLYAGVKGLSEAGSIPEAQNVLYAIKTDYFRALALAALGRAQANAKLTSQAEQTLKSALQVEQRSLSNKAMQANVLLSVGQALFSRVNCATCVVADGLSRPLTIACRSRPVRAKKKGDRACQRCRPLHSLAKYGR